MQLSYILQVQGSGIERDQPSKVYRYRSPLPVCCTAEQDRQADVACSLLNAVHAVARMI